MAKIDTVLWDWNGTLLNDVALCSELINTMLTNHGYAPVGDLNAYRRVFCFPIETYYKNAGFDFSRHPFPALADEYMALYTPRSLACTLQPYAQETLGALQACGVRQAVLSASERTALAAQVAHFGLTGYFDALIGIDNVLAHSKTAVGKAWFAASGACPARTLMIGDSVHDCEVADAIGVHCVLYSRGHQPAEALAATGAPVIDDLRALPRFL